MSGTTSILHLTRIDNVAMEDIALISSNNEYVDQGLTFVETENCNDVLMSDLYFCNINYDAAKGVYMWWYDQPNANIELRNIHFVDVYGGPFISFWNPDSSTIDVFNLSIKCHLINYNSNAYDFVNLYDQIVDSSMIDICSDYSSLDFKP